MLKHIERPASFLRQMKKMKRKHYDLDVLESAIRCIMSRNIDLLVTRYKDHALAGNLAGFRELHVQDDWLLIYSIEHETLTLILVTTGSHDDLF
ncbi:type II toxin-antitoxin system YafQ family toxin [Bifidobacterium aquikefiricola]|uniref:Type II toxin-antitoxin system YafQ family toxin n=1 Tax=Bifidobacterium aquikefiricola TaxID=3059038 RepID=A0AB39U6L1_9BIFI